MNYIRFVAFMLAVAASPAYSGETAVDSAKLVSHVVKGAVWEPGTTFSDTLHARCGAVSYPEIGACFESLMKEYGASPDAVAFARSRGNEAWLRAFRDTGRVDVAYLTYPFRANENQGVQLVNGVPSPVDVDNLDPSTQDGLKQDQVYSSLAKRYPDISLWPGDRYSQELPIVEPLAERRLRFHVGYLLRNGCHACEEIGSAVFAFDFDAGGKFQGTKLMMVTDTSKGKFSDPTVPIKVKAGSEFSLVVASNPTTGYQWSLAESPNKTVVKFSGKSFRPSAKGLMGAGGTETWTFKAVGRGNALIFLRYARSWEKDIEPVRQAAFVVVVR